MFITSGIYVRVLSLRLFWLIVVAPYIPPIDPSNASDTQNFDDTFLDMEPVLDDVNDEDEDIEGGQTDTDRDGDAENTDTDRESNTTPSQSRSSSAVRKENVKDEAEDEAIDVFDGYSFKGRHSVILDEEEEEEEGEGDGEEVEVDEEEVEVVEVPEEQKEDLVAPTPTPGGDDDEEPEPKTPEARPVVLPPEDSVPEPVDEPVDEPAPEPEREPEAVVERTSVTPEPPSKPSEIEVPVVEPPPLPEKEVTPPLKTAKPPTTTTKVPVPPPKGKLTRTRREKSGVPALDRYLSDATVDEDADTGVPSRDDEDDDWDFIDAVDGEDRNGAKGTSLFARGVVDRYRLAVFRRGSSSIRTFSGVSESEAEESPSRGRNPGLTFRKHPRQFLRPRVSRQSSHTTVSTNTASSTASPISNAPSSLSTASSGFLVPSSTSASLVGSGSVSSPGSPSLKSKESAMSVGAQSSSDGDAVATDVGTIARGEEPEKLFQKNRKLKKYKENAEKVFSIFSGSSPKQQHQHQQPQQ